MLTAWDRNQSYFFNCNYRLIFALLEAFVEFMRIDRDLLEVAAAGSPEAGGTALTVEVKHWVSNLPEAEKTSLLVRLIEGNEPHLRAELMRRYRESRTLTSSKAAAKRRTVGELLKAAERRAEERRRREAERAAQERARREQEAAEARERYLVALSQREAEAWREVDALIATKQPGKYDDAVKLLKDLRDIAIRAGRQGEVEARLVRLREQHAKKPSLVARLQAAGLIGTTKEGRL
jgi:FtsZ-interacting cell division protein YlmF